MNKFHMMPDPEKPGVKHRRMQVAHAEAELAETKRMMRSDPMARTGVVANEQQAETARRAYARIKKATS